jgi:hypothetical protein
MSQQKRKPSYVTKSLKVPFRPALYTQHLEGQRSFKWTEYQALAATEKESFFTSVFPFVNTLNAHFVGAEDQLFLTLTRPSCSVRESTCNVRHLISSLSVYVKSPCFEVHFRPLRGILCSTIVRCF